jgi:coniferyl-aldehyde dehydrogenase
MLKPSEFVPATTALTASMLADIFAEEQVAVVQGDAKVGAAFTRLPFDHLLFTGSTQVGRAVMRAASDNLVPVTLELGGKSPVIVERGYDLATAAKRVAYGKLLNAGQTCVAPDYVLVPKEEVEAFATAFKDAAATLYPHIATNPNYTWIVNDHHFARLSGLLEDAKAKGARVIDVGGTRASGEQPQSRMFLPALVLGATGEMSVMQEEIFGPILPVVPYADLEEAVAFVNARPRPLALYFFGPHGPGRKLVLEHTTSGNVAINETMLHYAQEDLPFGGVGQSGMGLYHGREGFKSMSHAKGVFAQGPISFADLIRPPYGRVFDFLLRWNMR